MEHLGYKFKLSPKKKQIPLLAQFAGCSRLVYNALLAWQNEQYADYLNEIDLRLSFCEASSLAEAKTIVPFPPYPNRENLCHALLEFKEDPKYSFLKDCYSQVLQQSAIDLSIAFKNFFKQDKDSKKKSDNKKSAVSKKKKYGPPQFKKKHIHDSFRIPQGFKLDEKKNRVFIPKIGWIKYFNSRDLIGTPKNITIFRDADGWYMSVCCEFENTPEITELDLSTAVAIDVGVARFCTLSDGTFIESLKGCLKPIREKIKQAQRSLARKQKGSNRFKRAKQALAKLYKKERDVRDNFLHYHSTQLVKNHDVIVVEDLKIKNMTKSSKGTIRNPGRNVRQKAGLNRSILEEAWGKFIKLIDYKLRLKGGKLIPVPTAYSSQTCPICGCISKENRKTQKEFRCIACGYTANADFNAAQILLKRAQPEIEKLAKKNS